MKKLGYKNAGFYLILLGILVILPSDAAITQSSANVDNEISIRWSVKRSLPAPSKQGNAVVCDNQVYYIGGRDSHNKSQNTVFKYDDAKNEWKTCPPMPTPRWNFAATQYRGKIYVIGGDIGISKTEVYHPETNSWISLPPLPTQRISAGCVAIDDMIYVIGGWEEDAQPSRKNEALNLKTQKWETKASLPAPRTSFGATLFDGKIYIFGGTGEVLTKPINGKGSYFSKPERTIFVYHPQSDTWERHESEIPVVRIGTRTVLVDNQVFLLGGYTIDENRNESILTRIDVFDPKHNRWLRATDLPVKLLFSGIAPLNSSILVIGGWDEHYKTTAVVIEGRVRS
jgi:N-acetylneuraminic acid mutarotase